MPISGWIMVAWFLLVILAGAGLLVWGWRAKGGEGPRQARYANLESRGPEQRRREGGT